MLKVGLTGGIGSGKSIVANIFKVLGIPVFDADDAAKNIMNEDKELKKNIIRVFGNDAYADGKLNRKYIADIVFKDAAKLKQLDALVHPATIKAAEKWALQQTSLYTIKEAALIFEAGSETDLDYVIGVSAPENLRISRVIKRDNITKKEVLLRMNKQIEEDKKMSLCDFVIINDEKSLVVPQVIALHEKLSALSKQKQ